jgi:glycosyltransferase involved in cell wall biosynthesis
VQSERMKLEMHERGTPLERMTAVPMGISLDLVEKGEATVPPEVPPVVLYVGGLQVVRRLEILIDCFAEVARRHQQVQFRVVGDGSVPEDRARLERRAASSSPGSCRWRRPTAISPPHPCACRPSS